jgi:probable rRNA maturation factor
VVVDVRGRRLPSRQLSAWLSRVAPPAAARASVTIALVTDARIRALNRAYRRRDTVTDVLSFAVGGMPAGRGSSAAGGGGSSRGNTRKLLGDIVIAKGVARRQARRAGHSETDELRTLALHGLLHLMGYDHHSDDGTMARLEERLRRKGGLQQGLIGRAQRQ